MTTRKERLLRVLREGIRVRRLVEAGDPSSEVWDFDDQEMIGEMKKILSEEWNADQGRLCRWLAPSAASPTRWRRRTASP